MTDALGTDARMTVDPPGSLVARDARLRIEGATRTGGHALTRRSGRYGRYGSTCPSETARPMIARMSALREQWASWAILCNVSRSESSRGTGVGRGRSSFSVMHISVDKTDIEASRSISLFDRWHDQDCQRLRYSRKVSYVPCRTNFFSSKILWSFDE